MQSFVWKGTLDVRTVHKCKRGQKSTRYYYCEQWEDQTRGNILHATSIRQGEGFFCACLRNFSTTKEKTKDCINVVLVEREREQWARKALMTPANSKNFAYVICQDELRMSIGVRSKKRVIAAPTNEREISPGNGEKRS